MRSGSGRSIDFSKDNIVLSDDYEDDGPEVRPDGQKPRVKSNILAALAASHRSKDKAAKFKHSKRVFNFTTKRPFSSLSNGAIITTTQR